MTETKFLTAKTVEEAFLQANRLYADERHEVTYEIVETPKKGFLGLGSRDAKLKITITEIGSGDLSSLVSDIKSMKKYTEKGEDRQQQKQKPEQNAQHKAQQKQNNNNPNRENNRDSRQNEKRDGNRNDKNRQNERKGEKPAQQNQKPEQNAQHKADRNQQKPKQEAPAPKAEKPAPAQEKPQQRSALSNSAKPRQNGAQKKGKENIASTGVTVSFTMNLSEFKSKETAPVKPSAGRMNNDIRRGNKAHLTPANKEDPDKLIKSTKYDVAESDEDYASLHRMVLEAEEGLEGIKPAASAQNESKPKEGKSRNRRRRNKNKGERAEKSHETEQKAPVKKHPTDIREAVTQEEMDFALEFANTLLKNMNLDARAVAAECPEGEEYLKTETATVYPKIDIVGDDTGILIGHHGETLDSIQYLTNLCALRKTKSGDGDYVKIVVNIENYREKREETLRSLARRMAARAVKYKRNVFLEPMNAYERRIIHSELQSYPDVSTHSVGSDRDRKIIVTYEGEGKVVEKDAQNSAQTGSSNGKKRRRRNRNKNKGDKLPEIPELTEAQEALEDEYAARIERMAAEKPQKTQKVSIDRLDEILSDHGMTDFEKE